MHSEPMTRSYCLLPQINNKIRHKLSIAMEVSSRPSQCCLWTTTHDLLIVISKSVPSHTPFFTLFSLTSICQFMFLSSFIIQFKIQLPLQLAPYIYHLSSNHLILRYIQITPRSFHLLIRYLASAVNLCHTYMLSLSLLDYKTPWKQGISLTCNNTVVLVENHWQHLLLYTIQYQQASPN